MTFTNLGCIVLGHRMEVEFIPDPGLVGGYLARRLCSRCGWHEVETAKVYQPDGTPFNFEHGESDEPALDVVEPLVKNAIRCGICGAPADRYAGLFRCQQTPGHIADLYTGIFIDCTIPEKA